MKKQLSKVEPSEVMLAAQIVYDLIEGNNDFAAEYRVCGYCYLCTKGSRTASKKQKIGYCVARNVYIYYTEFDRVAQLVEVFAQCEIPIIDDGATIVIDIGEGFLYV